METGTPDALFAMLYLSSTAKFAWIHLVPSEKLRD